MKRPIIIALLSAVASLFTSCVTEGMKARICRTCPVETLRKDSIGPTSTKTTEKDSTFKKAPLIGPEVAYSNCDSLLDALEEQGKIIEQKNGVILEIEKKGKKGMSFKCKTDSLEAVIRQLTIEKSTPHYTTITKVVTARCDKEHLQWYDIACRWVSGILLALLAGFITIKIILSRV